MSKDFLADMQVGDLGEQLWAAWLNAKGGDSVISEGKCNWDIFDKTTDVYYEVKMDLKAYYWAERRGESVNLFLEYETAKGKKPCGIMKTDAKYLVYIVRNKEKLHIAYTFELEKLRDYLWKNHKDRRFPIRKPVMHGVGNVNGWTPPVNVLVNEEGTGFMKLIMLPISLLNPSHEKTLSELSLLEATNRPVTE